MIPAKKETIRDASNSNNFYLLLKVRVYYMVADNDAMRI